MVDEEVVHEENNAYVVVQNDENEQHEEPVDPNDPEDTYYSYV